MTATTLLDPGPELPSGDPESSDTDTSPKEIRPQVRPEWVAGLTRSLARPTTRVVLVACVVGTAIRLVIPRGIWLDEAISVHDAHLGYGRMIHTLASTDVHPPLYFSVLWAWVRVAGFGAFALRVPSIIVGVLLIPMVYLLGKEAYGRRTGTVAAVLVSVAPLLVWYSQEVRMYEQLMLLGVIALWAQLRVFHRGGAYAWDVYTLATIAMMWTQYFAAWQILFQQAVFLGVMFVRWRHGQPVRRLVVGWAVSAALILAALVPLVVLAHQQFSVHQATGQAFGVGGVGLGHLGIYSIIVDLAWGLVGYHSNPDMAILVALWPLGMLLSLVLLGRRAKPVSYLLCGAVLVPVVMMFLLGLEKQELFDIRYMSTIVPILFILAARVITGVANSRRAVTVATVALVMVLLVALVDEQYASPNPRRYDFNVALDKIDQQARPGDVILYRPVDLWSVIQYYSPHVPAGPLTAQPKLPVDGHEVFVISSKSLMDGTTDNLTLTEALDDLGVHRKLVEQFNVPNVQVAVYK